MILPSPPTSCKVYTPKLLADAMVQALYRSNTQRWLEPSCGTGVFLEAMHDVGVPQKKVVGVDLDRSKSKTDSLGTVTRNRDFLDWSKSRKGRFDCVVGNPPYVAINQLPASLREVASATKDFDLNPVGERANTWYPFMIQAVNVLRPGGCLAFVLPASCEFADYAASGRSKLTRLFERVDLIRSRRPLFNEVAEGAVVLVARNKGNSQGLYRRHEVDDLVAAISKLNRLDSHRAKCCPNSSRRASRNNTVKFGDISDVRIGGVTGDSNYFVLSEEQRTQLRLPESSFVRVLSRSKHVLRSSHTAESWSELCSSGDKVWLFRPQDRHLRQIAVDSYLKLAPEDGGCDKSRYKIKARVPWHRTPLPDTPEFFLSGMSGAGLWMCINECADLNATNTLYVGSFREALSRNQKYSWALAMLTSPVQKQVLRAKRIYADGLSKLEPGQIADLSTPQPPKIPRAVSTYRQAVDALFSGEPTEAAEIADSHVLQF